VKIVVAKIWHVMYNVSEHKGGRNETFFNCNNSSFGWMEYVGY